MRLKLLNYEVHCGPGKIKQLIRIIQKNGYSRLFVLVDDNTRKHCYPLLKPQLPEHLLVKVPAGERNKNLDSCKIVWQALTDAHADRKALLINLGGGVVGDLGGFAASTYKRGISYIHVPTTLMAQADACIGGKVAIDFEDFKNQIGAFKDPEAVFIDPGFLKTLPERELKSGFSEIIKHSLIAGDKAFHTLAKQSFAEMDWPKVIEGSVELKSKIVEKDPFEKDLRKALNYGHTIGHAVESTFLQIKNRKLLHGEAVAIGLIAESFLSFKKGLLSISVMEMITDYILSNFSLPSVGEDRAEMVLDFIKQDKKNENESILCTLLNGLGSFRINQQIHPKEVREALKFYNLSVSVEV